MKLQKLFNLATDAALHAGATEASGISDSALDVSVLTALVGHDPATLADFLQTFEQSARLTGAHLLAAGTDADMAQVQAQAHKLKSAALSVGALKLGALCAQLEAAGMAAQSAEVALLLPRFEAELAAVNGFLAERLSNLQIDHENRL